MTASQSLASRTLAYALGLCLALGAMAFTACGGDKVVVKDLTLRVSSEAPRVGGRLERLRILFEKDGKHFPARLDQVGFNPVLDALDPVARPVLIQVAYDGATFGDGLGVSLEVTGLMAGRPVTRFAGTVDLDAEKIVDVRLLAIGDNCDIDGDGFLDCSGAGCCPGGNAFSDCEPASAIANPWGTEDACEPCSDTVDNDCQGGDEACVDSDSDTIPDCAEEACGSANDPAVGPGLPELCDERDNNCDGATDEGLTINYLGQTLAKGAPCGTGLCAGGAIECDGAGALRCSTDALKHATEDCATPGDDDCNGLTNEGCEITDIDGDGYVGDLDCNDHDSGIFKGGQSEPCCPASARGTPALEAACDKNCDGEVAYCADGDGDGDGFTLAAGDCDDTNALIYPGAPERCGDGVDQDCFAGDLVCTGIVDADHDGWAQELDCDDHDANRRPDAPEVCDGVDNNCNNEIDEGNPTGKPAGETVCGSTLGECAAQRGVWVCRNSGGTFLGTVDCVGDIEPVGPVEIQCDGKDDDCDGETDEDFLFQGVGIGGICDGTGECGQGKVECSRANITRVTCSTNPDGSDSGAKPEVCDQLDNDCDGQVNEELTDVAVSTCSTKGVCGANLAAIHASCNTEGTWDCDYKDVPDYEADFEKSCDGKDNDCNGTTDTEFAVGTGCDGADPDHCDDGTIVCSPTDVTQAICNDGPTTDAGVEVCDGKDNDCDGQTDEDFKSGGTVSYAGGPYAADSGKVLGDTCGTGLCAEGHVVCDPTDTAHKTLTCDTLAAKAIDNCNGVDDDCDGKTDEDYAVGGSVSFDGGAFSGDAGKHKGDTCGTGLCAGGTVVCDSTTTLKCSTKNLAVSETCNNVDDSCDGATDERFKAGGDTKYNGGANGQNKVLGDSCGTGECAGGHVICDTGDTSKLTCNSLGHIATDACNDKDDNCDGTTDEDFLAAGSKHLTAPLYAADVGKAKGQDCGTGVCSAGKVVCSAAGDAVVCSTNGLAQVAETCDSLDNTCNGQTDEGQPDSDGDGTSDTCDTCTDADGDGWRKAGTPGTGCAHTTTDDCDDAANNTSDPDHDNVCGASDNCPNASNPTQVNSDSTRDATGDACDTCTDADNDGWRMAGTPGTACAHGTVDDCDDLLGNTSDPDADNVCGTNDNCPNTSNPTQVNSDSTRDATGDACDTCTDADNDGWRMAGTSGTECAHGITDDCDDALNNANDPDHDNICGASDNCPSIANPTQLNSDSNRPNDAGGDACDPCTDADNDGWRLAGSPGTGCTHTTEDDCNDTANNTQDTDHDNVCGTNDNCPTVANADQTNSDSNISGDTSGDACDTCTDADADGYRKAGTTGTACAQTTTDDCDDAAGNVSDIDHDNICGAADTCVDVDGDGWGRAGTNSGCVAAKANVADCDDTANNTNDSDHDNICSSGGAGICHGGAVSNCNDNCATVANTDQADADDDSVGDVVGCDTCVNADGDNWGRAGFTKTGCTSQTDDCDDTASNTNDPDHDNFCGASDNCPDVSNPDQANADNDATGDLCDTCTDADADGWRKAGTTGVACAHTTTDDCDDAAGNASDIDHDNICGAADTCVDVDGDGWGRATMNAGCVDAKAGVADCDDEGTNATDVDVDNVCGASDNCPSVANPTQVNSDNTRDATGDACDTCTDADNDGYRLLGTTGAACAHTTTDDCDDALGNTSDPDGDNICGGADNCPNVANADQANGDGDTFGNACDVCPSVTDPSQVDTDSDTVGDLCDNCVSTSNTNQTNSDADALGDACDNCDLVSNITQTDVDADGIGDACDTCTDMDGDGWGTAGNNAGCAPGKAGVTDCNDAVSNTADLDHDNICEPGDTCVDADGDGWGRAGFTRTGCAKPTVDDCDDTATNATNDPDADNVCNNGGPAACVTGATTGCADNCPSVANNTTGNVQVDTDRDGKGDSCDTACVLGPTPYEVCGDCIDNDCDGATDETATNGGCVTRRIIGVETDVEEAPPGYSFALQFDHAALVAGGRSTASGDDVRVFYKDPALACDDASWAACYREVDRVLDPLSTWNANNTTIWFAGEATIAPLSLSTDYEIYYGVTSGTPQNQEADVFHFADFFDRADAVAGVGNSWSVLDGNEGGGTVGTDIQILSHELNFVTTSDAATYAPSLSHTFPAISATPTTDAWDVRIGFHWHRQSGDTTWRVFMQLGLSSAMAPLDGTFVGLGPSLVWGSTSTISTGSLAVFTPRAGLNTSSVSDIGMHVDFSGGTPNYDLFYNGNSYSNVPFSSPAQSSLDTVRFGADSVGATFDRKAFDYVIVQRSVVNGAPPVAGLGVEEPLGATCALGGTTDIVAKYKLDDATEGTPNPATVTDSTANPITLTRSADGANGPDFVTFGTFGSLFWTGGTGNDGQCISAALGPTGNDLGGLDGITKATIEVVVDSDDNRAATGGGAYFFNVLREDGSSRLSFYQVSGTASGNVRVAFNGGTVWSWTVNTYLAGRTVYHVVIDTTLPSVADPQAAATDRIQLYRDGMLLTPSTRQAIAQNTALDTITTNGSENSAKLVLGNDGTPASAASSMAGVLYYAAVYKNALTSAQVLANALILLRDDDK